VLAVLNEEKFLQTRGIFEEICDISKKLPDG
jgi:hypothetical protein